MGGFMELIVVFGKNLKKYREQVGMSQEKFAEMCGLHRTYISDIERFQRNISLSNVQKIAQALKIEPYIVFVNPKVYHVLI